MSKQAQVERQVLGRLHHPMINTLRYSFQNTRCLFLVLDYQPGGDLSQQLARLGGRVQEDLARVYIAELVLALEYIHSQNIIYRDLKPQNVMLDINGHCLLADFGLSKQDVGVGQTAISFCGSLAYLAPEVLNR